MEPAPSTESSAPPRSISTRTELDSLLARCTNYERMPEFHAGRVRFDLARMREYVARLGHPERAAPVVHVTGTKGKGSTAALVAWILSRVGRRTGLHTSPHLHSMEERILVDFQPIGDPRLVSATNAILEAAFRRGRDELQFPTFFEFITLAAMLEFRAADAAFAVHEVGIGGALDATNVVSPAATAITNVALEHTAVLGDTVEAIAAEKSGIVKPGADVVTALARDHAALPIVARAAARAGSRLFRVGAEVVIERAERIDENGSRGLSLDVRTWRARYSNLRPAVLGMHQAENVAVAIALVEMLRESGRLDATPGEIGAALAGFRMPARLEPLPTEPLVVVDGAHTPESIGVALREARATFPQRRTVVVFAMADDKDWARAARSLASADFVVTTRYANPRATDPDALAGAVVRSGGRARSIGEVGAAVDFAREMAEKEGFVLVLGSLYLAAEVRACRLGSERAKSGLWSMSAEGRPWSS